MEIRERAEWLDLQALGRYATVSERTLRDWIRLHPDPLPASRIGGKILIRKTAFDMWMERHRIVTHSESMEELVDEIVASV